jgi:diguanylate cyclase (GGDEF)-like protein
MNEPLQPLALLLEIARGVVRDDPEAIHRLEEMTGSDEVPSIVAELAEQISLLTVQKGAQELRLESMIEDLLETQAALANAKHDPLTGLPNRGLFHEFLRQACAEAGRSGQTLALMFIDLDKFKQVNDTLGHDAGDELLILVAQRLRACLREGDLLARLGGDEFTALLLNLSNQETGIHLAQRIVADLNKPFVLSMGQAEIGGSIGMSFFPTDTDQAVSLLKNADIAMYQAKEAGRNNYRLYRPARGARSGME